MSILNLSKERDALIKYVERLQIHEELKREYSSQIRLAFANLQSGDKRGVSQLSELAGKLALEQRQPLLEFLNRLEEASPAKPKGIEKETNKTSIDLAVICALKDPELNQILSLLSNPSEMKTDEFGAIESHTYYQGVFRHSSVSSHQGLALNVVAAHQSQIGIVDCAILATKVIQRWKPKYLAMTGVCGGRKSCGIRLGDIIVPTEIFTYQTGEFTDEGFMVKPKVVDMNHGLTQRIQACAEWIPYEIIKSWPGTKHDPPRVWTQPLACGDAVINRKEMLEKEVAALNQDVIGVDMESYAVLRATRLFSKYHTTPLVVKSVMDFTEEKNTISDKAFAAFASARFLYYFALAELVSPT